MANISDTTSNSNAQSVTVKAIDGDALILETTNHELMRWPLENIPQPLELGSKLMLELKSEFPATTTDSTPTNKHSSKETKTELQQMYKLLEKLVN